MLALTPVCQNYFFSSNLIKNFFWVLKTKYSNTCTWIQHHLISGLEPITCFQNIPICFQTHVYTPKAQWADGALPLSVRLLAWAFLVLGPWPGDLPSCVARPSSLGPGSQAVPLALPSVAALGQTEISVLVAQAYPCLVLARPCLVQVHRACQCLDL